MRAQLISRRQFVRACAAAAAWLVAACSGPEAQNADAPLHRRNTARDADSAATPRATGTAADSAKPRPSATHAAAAPAQSGGAQDVSAPPAPADGAPDALPSAPLTISVDDTLPAPLKTIATGCRDQAATQLSATPIDGDADLVITLASADAPASHNRPVVPVDYVAVVSRRLLVRALSMQQLSDAWHGVVQDWANYGSPDSHQIVPVTLGGFAGPFPADKAVRNFDALDALADFLIGERGGLALIPLAYLDFRFRALDIEGVNVLRPGDAVNPLRVVLDVRSRVGLSPQEIARIQSALAPANGPAPTSMTWVGDIIFGRKVHEKMVEYGDWAAPFRSIWPELVWADTTIGDLECSLSDSFETPTDWSTFQFKTSTAAVAGLQLAQIDVLSRANNHSFNFGPQGMQDTTDTLDAAGILHFGMGQTMNEARRAAIIERNGVTYSFIGYNGISDDYDAATADSAGTTAMLDWMVVEDIQRELANGHVVIPYFHWGVEYTSDPTDQQRYFAHTAIEAGAAMVMGSHPHWVQAVETYRGKPIVYSLGNFVFDQDWSLETQQGLIAHVWLQADKVLKIDLLGVFIEDEHKPRLMADAEAAPVLERVWAASDAIIAAG